MTIKDIRYQTIDLQKLPFPQAISPVLVEREKQALLQDYILRLAKEQNKNPEDINYPFLESDPAYKLIETCAYRLALEKQRRNEAIKAVMLSMATGSDLDQLGANVNVQRLVIKPAQLNAIPPQSAVMEDDDDFRARIQESMEKYTTAGSIDSYDYWCREASGDVLDVQVTSPTPGVVVNYILSRQGDGAADDNLLNTVNETVNAEEIRPLTDQVFVKSATIFPYTVSATLDIFDGPDQSVVKSAAASALQKYTQQSRMIGGMVALSGIYAALQQPGVRNVVLHSPTEDIAMETGQSGFCKSIVINDVEVDNG